MSVNLFSLETLTGLILGLLLGFFIKNVFKKKEDLGDYSKNLETLTDKIEEFQEQNAEERGEVKEKLKAAKEEAMRLLKQQKQFIEHLFLAEDNSKVRGENWFLIIF